MKTILLCVSILVTGCAAPHGKPDANEGPLNLQRIVAEHPNAVCDTSDIGPLCVYRVERVRAETRR